MTYENTLFEITRLQRVKGLSFLTAVSIVSHNFEADTGLNFREQLKAWQRQGQGSNYSTYKTPEAQLNEDVIEYSLSNEYKTKNDG